jgi:hypothetical protein
LPSRRAIQGAGAGVAFVTVVPDAGAGAVFVAGNSAPGVSLGG